MIARLIRRFDPIPVMAITGTIPPKLPQMIYPDQALVPTHHGSSILEVVVGGDH